MIISYNKKFVYLRTVKVASSSLEFYFSQYCSTGDLITPLFPDEKKQKKKFKILSKQNFEYQKFSLSLKNILRLKFYKLKRIDEHSSIYTIFRTKFAKNIKNFFFFSFVRNPYDWIVSYFWWDLYYHKKKSIAFINNLNQKDLESIFKIFLTRECSNFFKKNKKIISSKFVDIKIFKLENIESSLKKIRKKLNLTKEKIKISEIKLKKLKIRKKIKINSEDKKLILKSASYFFDKYKYSKKLPYKYL